MKDLKPYGDINRRAFATMALLSGLGVSSGVSACSRDSETVLTPGPLYQRSFSRMALAGDGSACLVMNRQGPPNEALLIDLKSGERLTIAHPDPTMGLLEGSFSPDGQTLALVVAKPTSLGPYTGLSEIHLLDRSGGLKRRIASAFYYREPAFSPDGSRLAYLRDVTGDSSSTGRPDPQPRERQFRALALYERDIEGDSEQRLDAQAFVGGKGLSYGRATDEIWFSPGEPLGLIDGSPENGVWLSSNQARATGPGMPYDRCALKRRGEPLDYPLLSIVDSSIDLTNMALVGFSESGVLLSNWRSTGSGGVSELYLLADRRLTHIWSGLPNVPSDVQAIARDGSVIAVGDQGPLRRARDPLRLTLLQRAMAGGWTGRAVSLEPGTNRRLMDVDES